MDGGKRFQFRSDRGGVAVPSKKEQFQQIWHRYDSRQDHKPSSLRQAVSYLGQSKRAYLDCRSLILSAIWQNRWGRQFVKNTRQTRRAEGIGLITPFA